MRFRKKPVVIEAVQIKKGMGYPVKKSVFYPDWLVEALISGQVSLVNIFPNDEKPAFARVETLEGTMRANEGDWIIRGVKGELYPCRDDIFQATYEAVEEA